MYFCVVIFCKERKLTNSLSSQLTVAKSRGPLCAKVESGSYSKDLCFSLSFQVIKLQIIVSNLEKSLRLI